VAFVRKAKDVDQPAAWLFVPYIAWVLFAGYLNAEFVLRNGYDSRDAVRLRKVVEP
jgi:tryptophan-rich sensory protein